MLIPFFRIIKTGFADFWRNKWVSQATLGVMVITLFVMVSFFILGGITGSLIDNLKARMDISVYFKIDTDETDILEIKDSLEGMEQVTQIEYISRSEALAQFKKRHQDDPLILQSLEEIGSNPLTASLNVQAREPSTDFPFISQYLDKNYEALIDKVNYQENKESHRRQSDWPGRGPEPTGSAGGGLCRFMRQDYQFGYRSQGRFVSDRRTQTSSGIGRPGSWVDLHLSEPYRFGAVYIKKIRQTVAKADKNDKN